MNLADHASLLVEEKRALRRAMGERREALSTAERLERSRRLCAQLATLSVLKEARVVAGYVAVKGEIDVSAVTDAAAGRGATVVLPRVSKDYPRLRFHRATGPETLQYGRFGLLEPVATALELSPEEVDVMLVPGLAFDERGHRLGFGGGYYDEALGRMRAAGRGVLIGVGYDFQIVERCPAGEGDACVDALASDDRFISCTAGRPIERLK